MAGRGHRAALRRGSHKEKLLFFPTRALPPFFHPETETSHPVARPLRRAEVRGPIQADRNSSKRHAAVFRCCFFSTDHVKSH